MTLQIKRHNIVARLLKTPSFLEGLETIRIRHAIATAVPAIRDGHC